MFKNLFPKIAPFVE